MPQPNNNDRAPIPPVPPLVPPYVNSVYNVITQRIRARGTIFGDRVKLVLRQVEEEHWSKLKRPYLLVVPRQTRAPRDLLVDIMSFTNPREVTFVAQFDDRQSPESYLAANDIDTAERQLIFALANWRPYDHYKPTTYGGMRIQATRAPDVKVHYIFMFNEEQVIRDEDVDDDSELEPVILDEIKVNVADPRCLHCIPDPVFPPGPTMRVGVPPLPEDPCPPPECPPMFETGGDDANT